MVASHQTFGEFGVWHPHWHTIVLEGGFDRHDNFFFIPWGGPLHRPATPFASFCKM